MEHLFQTAKRERHAKTGTPSRGFSPRDEYRTPRSGVIKKRWSGLLREVAMAEPPPDEVSQLLRAWNNGDQAALSRLMPLVYDELRRMAKRYVGRHQPGRTLQTTALIHEAYLRLVGQKPKWHNCSHFFAVGAQAMRHILVDYARSRRYAKRGGGERVLSLDETVLVTDERAAELVALDEALTELSALHPRQARVVECRFFGGLTAEETAEVLRMAKAWLGRALKRRGSDDA
jgi:RNA polymerase sigma factor (TIGR02999 family)